MLIFQASACLLRDTHLPTIHSISYCQAHLQRHITMLYKHAHLLIVSALLLRHRLTVPKYNPARTFTPEGAVGIGGSYMCIYPMESPGGYQLVGRTLPIWNTFGRTGPFSADKPWLLRIFDQVRGDIMSRAKSITYGVCWGCMLG